MPTACTDTDLDLAVTAERVPTELGPELERALEMVRARVARGGTLFSCGNGGSATDAQRTATGHVVDSLRSRRTYPAIALAKDRSLITAAGNGIGFQNVCARQVEALARAGELLVIHSTSGDSFRVQRAAEFAREKDVARLAFSAGDGGALRALADHSVMIPTTRTGRAQALHLCVEPVVGDRVQRTL